MSGNREAGLVAALRKSGLEELAQEAEDGQYAPPFHELVRYLRNIGTPPALLMAVRLVLDEFDGSSDLWTLVKSWEASARQIDDRTLLGDPAANIATANTLRSCANRLRAALAAMPQAQREAADRLDEVLRETR